MLNSHSIYLLPKIIGSLVLSISLSLITDEPFKQYLAFMLDNTTVLCCTRENCLYTLTTVFIRINNDNKAVKYQCHDMTSLMLDLLISQ